MDAAVKSEAVYQFGPFRLDPAERLLLRHGEPVPLTPKAFDLLAHLAARSGRLVEKDALMAALWPDAIVEEANLTSTVSALRKALGDDGQRFIATVPTRGYRFVAAVSAQTATPSEITTSKDSRPAQSRLWWRTIIVAAACGIAAFAAGWVLAGRLNHTPPPRLNVQVDIAPAEGIRGPEILLERLAGRNRPSRTSIALSPDGRHLVFAGVRGEKSQLWLRPLDSDQATPLAGTEDGAAPFFSPDGRWVGFWGKRALWKVPLAGGPPVKICDSIMPFGASWGSDGRIVFSDRQAGGLFRVSDDGGGTPEVLTRPDLAKGEGSHRLPFVLPGAKAVLFTVVAIPDDPRLGADIGLRLLETGEQRVLIRDAADARYVSSGHLVYVANGTLTAVPFDVGTRRITGAPVGIVDKIMQANYGGNTGLVTMAGQFALSESGSLAWLPAALDPNPEQFRTLVWVDRHGNSTPIDAVADAYYGPRLSPDGHKIAVMTAETMTALWIYDVKRGIRTRLPFDGLAVHPQWTPDGKRVAFSGTRAGRPNLFWIPIDGSGPAERLTTDESVQLPAAWTPDGRTLIYIQSNPAANQGGDIWEFSLDRKREKSRPIVQTAANEVYPRLSPDGQWLAYVGNESGRAEVYVQGYPMPTAKPQVSSGGGMAPTWSRDGHILYYYAATSDGIIYFAVDISTKPAFTYKAPRRLFVDAERKYVTTGPIGSFDVAPDGRFLMVEVKRGPGVVPPAPSDVRLLVNWASHLR